MEETYLLLIKFKTIHPLRFWTAIFVATSIIIFAIWKLLRKKQKSNNEQVENKKTTTTVIVAKKTDKPKLIKNKDKSTIERPQTKVYTDKPVKSDLEVNEPKSIYLKPTETKQVKVTSKVEAFEVKPKAKPKFTEQLPKAKVETTKPKDEVLFVKQRIHFQFFAFRKKEL